MKRPVIGVSAVTAFNERIYAQRITYPDAIWDAGGVAIMLPCAHDTETCEQIVSMLDGLLVPGGADIDPALYGEEVRPVCGKFNRSEDNYDIALIKEALKQGKTILATCRGLQIINVLFGGTLYQDIPTQYETDIIHAMGENYAENYHPVKLDPNCKLAEVLGNCEVKANTSHHQCVKDLGHGLKIVGRAPDGIVEAIENEDASIIAVQWHPERMQDMEMYRNLFKYFIDKCK